MPKCCKKLQKNARRASYQEMLSSYFSRFNLDRKMLMNKGFGRLCSLMFIILHQIVPPLLGKMVARAAALSLFNSFCLESRSCLTLDFRHLSYIPNFHSNNSLTATSLPSVSFLLFHDVAEARPDGISEADVM